MISPTEHEEQRAFVQWFRRQYPNEIIFAIPNGGQRSKSQGSRLKAEGVMAGVWDLYCPDRHLWIEFKRRDKGSVSKAQQEFGVAMIELGYRCMVAWGCDDAIDQIKSGERAHWDRASANKRGKNG